MPRQDIGIGLTGGLRCGAIGIIFAMILGALKAEHAFAATTDNPVSDTCDQAAAIAAASWGVPIDVLMAITRVETGRPSKNGLRPWPWTVNMEGAGRWFATEDEARAYVFKHFKRGARSFDVGCFQLNYKWHGAAFQSIDDMFNPMKNANYAARFLADLHAEFGDWTKAAGAYHSRSREFADLYEARFTRIRSSGLPLETKVSATRRATFGPPRPLALEARLVGGPIVGRGASPRLGSLVSLVAGATSGERALVHLE